VVGEETVRGALMGFWSAASVAFLALVVPVAPAAASTYQITFAASDFDFQPAPVPFVLGQIDVTFDPASPSAEYENGPAKLDFVNFNLTDVGYFYNSDTDEVAVGGGIANQIGSVGGVDDFVLWIESFSTDPTFGMLEYASAADKTRFFRSYTGAVHVDVSATPIPATLPLFASALGGIGLIGWRRRRAGPAGSNA